MSGTTTRATRERTASTQPFASRRNTNRTCSSDSFNQPKGGDQISSPSNMARYKFPPARQTATDRVPTARAIALFFLQKSCGSNTGRFRFGGDVFENDVAHLRGVRNAVHDEFHIFGGGLHLDIAKVE